MIERIVRALRLEPALYQQVASSPQYMVEAVMIAVAVALISPGGYLFTGPNPVLTYLLQMVNNLLIGWVLWALITYLVGVFIYKGQTNLGAMLRVLAYASIPRLLGVFSLITCVGWALNFVGWLLSIVAGIIAVREVMGFDMNKAAITSIIGFILYILVSVIINNNLVAAAAPLGG